MAGVKRLIVATAVAAAFSVPASASAENPFCPSPIAGCPAEIYQPMLAGPQVAVVDEAHTITVGPGRAVTRSGSKTIAAKGKKKHRKHRRR